MLSPNEQTFLDVAKNKKGDTKLKRPTDWHFQLSQVFLYSFTPNIGICQKIQRHTTTTGDAKQYSYLRVEK